MSSIKQKSSRVGAFLLALLFFGTSVGFSGLVIWQIIKKPNTSENSTPTTPEGTPKEGQLMGTKLTNFTPVQKVDKLQSTDLVPGTGEAVVPGANVTAHYTGAVAADGTIFQSSHDSGQPVPFSLDGVIQGWAQGVPGMKVGGTRRLLIPAALAYGASPPPGSGIPANADLVFDIELVSVNK